MEREGTAGEGKEVVFYNELCAVNDPNGNPRRMLEVFNSSGRQIATIRYAYSSELQALREWAGDQAHRMRFMDLSTRVWMTVKEFNDRERRSKLFDFYQRQT